MSNTGAFMFLATGFWEHALRDERDYARHFDYIHYNPVKQGLVECPRDWPFSTIHRWVKLGAYDSLWGLPIRACPGMDCRGMSESSVHGWQTSSPDVAEMHPCKLDSGNPCRNDGVFSPS